MEPILFYLLIINLITFFVWGYDKKMARKNANRISETRLLWLIFLGGLFGGIIGMLIFRHKISKRAFLQKFFVVGILQLIILRFILRILWN